MPSPPPPDPLLRRLAGCLREICGREGMGLAELSLRADVGEELIRELEHAGGHVPKVATVLRLAGALGVRPGELVAGVRWVPIEVVRERGHFEIVEDPALAAEVAPCARRRPDGRDRHEHPAAMSDRRNWDLGADARVRLGQNAVVHRLRAGLSRAEVARRALVSEPWVKTAEDGRAGSSLDAWVRLAGVLDVTLDELLEGVTRVPAPPEAGDGEGGYVLD